MQQLAQARRRACTSKAIAKSRCILHTRFATLNGRAYKLEMVGTGSMTSLYIQGAMQNRDCKLHVRVAIARARHSEDGMHMVADIHGALQIACPFCDRTCSPPRGWHAQGGGCATTDAKQTQNARKQNCHLANINAKCHLM